MARYVECDVCDKKIEGRVRTIQVTVPGDLMGEDGRSVFKADVCSWTCLRQIAERFDTPAEEEPADDLREAILRIRGDE